VAWNSLAVGPRFKGPLHGAQLHDLFARFDFHDLSTPIHGFLIGARRARGGAPNEFHNAHRYLRYPLLGHPGTTAGLAADRWQRPRGVAAHWRNDGCRKGFFG